MRTEKKLSMKNIPSIAFSYPPLKKCYYSLKKSDNFDLYYLVSGYKIFFGVLMSKLEPLHLRQNDSNT